MKNQKLKSGDSVRFTRKARRQMRVLFSVAVKEDNVKQVQCVNIHGKTCKLMDGTTEFVLDLRKVTKAEKVFWYIVHNVICHPLLVLRAQWTNNFHDWTANRF